MNIEKVWEYRWKEEWKVSLEKVMQYALLFLVRKFFNLHGLLYIYIYIELDIKDKNGEVCPRCSSRME